MCLNGLEQCVSLRHPKSARELEETVLDLNARELLIGCLAFCKSSALMGLVLAVL